VMHVSGTVVNDVVLIDASLFCFLVVLIAFRRSNP
jgi:hypothetical protein